VLARIRAVPWGIGLFLVYAFFVLAGVGVTLQSVIDQAVIVPVTLVGIVDMALLAYTIFTVTLVLQRKAAARTLALGLSSLTLPPIPVFVLGGAPIVGLFLAALAGLLFRGLLAPATRTWLAEA
jgi:hypothetical protein